MNPSTAELARLAEASYGKGSHGKYERLHDISTPQMSAYYHPETKHYVVAHRGTDLTSPTASKDVKADLRILVGDKNRDSLHRARVGQTEDIYKKIRERDASAPIHLTSHSLGGSTSQHALIKSDYVRGNTASHNTFNAGSSPFQHKGINSKHKNYKAINDISTHHSIEGDHISASVAHGMIGKTKKYKSSQKPTIPQQMLKFIEPLARKSRLGTLAHFGATELTNTMANHSLDNFYKGKKK